MLFQNILFTASQSQNMVRLITQFSIDVNNKPRTCFSIQQNIYIISNFQTALGDSLLNFIIHLMGAILVLSVIGLTYFLFKLHKKKQRKKQKQLRAKQQRQYYRQLAEYRQNQQMYWSDMWFRQQIYVQMQMQNKWMQIAQQSYQQSEERMIEDQRKRIIYLQQQQRKKQLKERQIKQSQKWVREYLQEQRRLRQKRQMQQQQRSKLVNIKTQSIQQQSADSSKQKQTSEQQQESDHCQSEGDQYKENKNQIDIKQKQQREAQKEQEEQEDDDGEQSIYYEQSQENAQQLVFDLILYKNKLVHHYPQPKSQIKILRKFKNVRSYISTLVQLYKYEIICDVNQSIDKKLKSKKDSEDQITGKFLKEQEKFREKIFFQPSSQKQALKLSKKVLKGEKICIMSPTQYFMDQNRAQLCIIGYDMKSQRFHVTLPYSQDQDRYDRLVYIYDICPVVTSIRAMAGIFHVGYSIHQKKIIKPQSILKLQTNKKRMEVIDGKMMNLIMSTSNNSQEQTIRQLVSSINGIHLVQGPPGTGKTSTILNFLSLELDCLKKQKQNIILVCSESNAAIDDIARKIIQQGLLGYKKKSKQIVRLGQIGLDSEILIDFGLRHICQMQFGIKETSVKLWIEIQKKQRGLPALKGELELKQRKQIQKLFKKILQINKRVAESQKFQKIENEVLQNAKIILSTLSSSGRKGIIEKLKQRIGCLIVDEACQTIQPNILIPFQFDPKKVILVGDPNQLEATVNSKSVTSNFSRSLFERFISCKFKPHFLNTQYRMVPQISEFSNKRMYDDRIIDGRIKPKPTSFSHLNQNFQANSTIFIDIDFGKEERQNTSYFNLSQAKIIANIAHKFACLDPKLTIGVISPYAAQTQTVYNEIASRVPANLRENIKVSTVDAFQGQQRDIIIITCVRSNNNGQIGFLNNERRLNVALTRAKNALILVGNEKTLTMYKLWKSYVSFQKSKSRFVSFSSQNACQQYIKTLFTKA